MKHQSYFVSGLTTNQKIFLLSNGCGIEQNLERTYTNHWISKDGVKVTVKNKQAKAAWGLIQNSDLLIIPIEDYTIKPLSGTRADWVIMDEVGTRADWVIVDEVETISEELWKKLGEG